MSLEEFLWRVLASTIGFLVGYGIVTAALWPFGYRPQRPWVRSSDRMGS